MFPSPSLVAPSTVCQGQKCPQTRRALFSAGPHWRIPGPPGPSDPRGAGARSAPSRMGEVSEAARCALSMRPERAPPPRPRPLPRRPQPASLPRREGRRVQEQDRAWPAPVATHVGWGETILYRTTCARTLRAKNLVDGKGPWDCVQAAEGQLRTSDNTRSRARPRSSATGSTLKAVTLGAHTLTLLGQFAPDEALTGVLGAGPHRKWLCLA